MFTAALFTKTGKQSECLSTDEWVKNMEHYLAIKMNKTPSFAATWINLEMFILSEVNQTKMYDVTYMWSLKK